MAQGPTPSFCKAGFCDSSCGACHPREESTPRVREPKVTKRKSLGRWLFVYTRTGEGGIVPNHGPCIRKVMVSPSKEGWHLHLELKSLRTWNGYRTAEVRVALNPSKRRARRLQDAYTEKR